VWHQEKRGPAREPNLFTAYLFWLCSGFLGLHRLYLKSWWGLLYVPLFIGIAYANVQSQNIREDVSRTHAAFEEAKHALDRAKDVAARPPAADAPPAETAAASAALAKAQATLASSEAEHTQATTDQAHWFGVSRNIALVVALLLLVDALLLPRLVRRLRAAGDSEPILPDATPHMQIIGTGEDPTLTVHNRFTNVIDRVNTRVGQFSAYWVVIAVFAYFYEVVARYVFISPTNWVHESMFLMFGMQYMLSGAYAYHLDQHVRVDVIYSRWSPRGKAIADIITSVFFFIFTLTMLWTGIRFAWDAIEIGEHSFTEWYVQYWPVKLAIPIGAALIVLQGLSKLIKDIQILTRKGS